MKFREVFFIWVYFFCGAGGALWMIRFSEKSFGRVFHMIERTIRIENNVLKKVKDENETLDKETIKLQEKYQSLEDTHQQLEDIYFERIIGEGVR